MMRPYMCSPASCPATLSGPLPDLIVDSSCEKNSAGLVRALKSAIALTVALAVVPGLFAQQAQYDPDTQKPRPGYDQPRSDQPRSDQPGYDQPGYDQPGYDQRDNSQPPLSEQAPSEQPPSVQPPAQQPYEQSPNQQQPYADPGQPDAQPSYTPARALSAQDLEQLVAPIALYPDALVAQVLAASTYPAQVADADRWRRAQGYASSDQIAAAADAQSWDPSVKALTAFPQVLAQMDQNLHWTSELGNAYYNQPQDVLEAVQVMRRRAQQAGNLNSTPQEAVSYDQGNIEIAPVNPQVVYVPAYNPWLVYGQPVAPYPGFSLLDTLGSVFNSSVVRFGLGIAMNAFTHSPWGWLGWGLSWLTQSVLFQGSNYFSHSNTVADWGLPHGGPRAFSRGGTFAGGVNRGFRPGYGRSPRTFETPYRRAGDYGRTNGYGGNRSREFSRTPERGAYSGRGVYAGRDAYAGNRPAVPYSRGYQSFGENSGRSSPQAYNRFQPGISRSQQYGRSTYGSNSNYRSAENYGGRPGPSYGNSMRPYAAARASSQRSDFGKHSSRGFAGNNFSKSSFKQPHSGGFHLFGGVSHAPKSYGGGKSFSGRGFGGKSSGHGHSGGGHSGGKHHH